MSTRHSTARVIPYGRQDLNNDDLQSVVEVLRSDWLTQGPAVPAFEKCVASYTGAPTATAVCNATAALHIACLSVGLESQEWLWTVPNTFVASANCGLYCGARVDFVDIDPQTYNMSIEELSRKLEIARKTKRLPKIVVPVHFSGQPCDMRAIHNLAAEYGFHVIEDASHAIGGSYYGEKIGSGQYSDIAVFSFHPVKIVTTGEGGMALTKDAALNNKLKMLRTHGITRDAHTMNNSSEGDWYYEQTMLGLNYRMTDIQAALGTSQMHRIDRFIERRREIARRYTEAFVSLPILTPYQEEWSESAWHLYVIQIDDAAKRSRKEVFDRLRAAGILVNVHYIPVHLQPYYRGMGFRAGDFPISERYYSRCLSLPMYASLTDDQQEYVITQVREAVA